MRAVMAAPVRETPSAPPPVAQQPITTPPVKEDRPVKTEVKVAVLLAFFVILGMGLLWADHNSKARHDPIDSEIGVTQPGVSIPRQPEGSAPLTNPFVAGSASQAEAPPRVPATTTISEETEGTAGPVEIQNGSFPAAAGRDQVTAPRLVVNSEEPAPLEPGPAPRSEAPASTPAPVNTARANRADDQMHPVKAGETLRSITKKHYGTDSDQLTAALLQYNADKLPASGKLREGVTLRIPGRDELLAVTSGGRTVQPQPQPARTEPTPRPETARTTPPATVEASETRTYTVKAGDSPMSISKSVFGTTKRWKDIMKLNPGLREDNLKIGQKIKLPAKQSQASVRTDR